MFQDIAGTVQLSSLTGGTDMTLCCQLPKAVKMVTRQVQLRWDWLRCEEDAVVEGPGGVLAVVIVRCAVDPDTVT